MGHLVQWGDEDWASVTRLAEGRDTLQEDLAQTRSLIRDDPYRGALVDEELGLYFVRAVVLMGLLTVRVSYQINDPFVNLLEVQAIEPDQVRWLLRPVEC